MRALSLVTSESRGRKAICLFPNKLPWKQKVTITYRPAGWQARLLWWTQIWAAQSHSFGNNFRGRWWKHHESSSKTFLAGYMPLVSLQWLLRELPEEENSPAKFSGTYHTHPLFVLSIIQDQVWIIKPQKVRTVHVDAWRRGNFPWAFLFEDLVPSVLITYSSVNRLCWNFPCWLSAASWPLYSSRSCRTIPLLPRMIFWEKILKQNSTVSSDCFIENL